MPEYLPACRWDNWRNPEGIHKQIRTPGAKPHNTLLLAAWKGILRICHLLAAGSAEAEIQEVTAGFQQTSVSQMHAHGMLFLFGFILLSCSIS
jgi:hypothetical protein